VVRWRAEADQADQAQQRDDPPPEDTGSVTQSPGPPASRVVHRVEPPSALSTTSAERARATGVAAGRSELTRVQCIGARSAAALEAAGMDGLEALAAATPAEVSDALAAGGLRRSTTYATWPGQARELLDG
jgi:predicted flap endonuclease-1-like 5' DNA nuclease